MTKESDMIPLCSYLTAVFEFFVGDLIKDCFFQHTASPLSCPFESTRVTRGETKSESETRAPPSLSYLVCIIF